jgi:hypothetical protein
VTEKHDKIRVQKIIFWGSEFEFRKFLSKIYKMGGFIVQAFEGNNKKLDSGRMKRV